MQLSDVDKVDRDAADAAADCAAAAADVRWLKYAASEREGEEDESGDALAMTSCCTQKVGKN